VAEGDGRYGPLPEVGAVVAVVGTAHVRGIVRAWQDALGDHSVAQYVE
jgi:pheromone shutdown protein TraB